MIKGNKVYLTRDLHTSNNGSRPLSLAPFCLKNLCYTVLLTLVRPGNKFTKISVNKNLKNNALHIVSCVAVVSQFS